MSGLSPQHNNARMMLIVIVTASLLVGMSAGIAGMEWVIGRTYVVPVPTAWLVTLSSSLGLVLAWGIFASSISIRRIGLRVFADQDTVRRVVSRGMVLANLVFFGSFWIANELLRQPTRLPTTPLGPVQTVIGWAILSFVGLMLFAGMFLMIKVMLEKPWNPREHERQDRTISKSR